MATSFVSSNFLLAQTNWSVAGVTFAMVMVVAALLPVAAWLCVRYIPNNAVGVVEKLLSVEGSVPEGQIIALDGEAGFQAELRYCHLA